MAEITIYTTMLCPYCYQAMALLKKKGADFEQIDVTMSPGKRAEMRTRAGGRNTVPQIFISGRHVGDCDDLHALEAAGELDALLATA